MSNTELIKSLHLETHSPARKSVLVHTAIYVESILCSCSLENTFVLFLVKCFSSSKLYILLCNHSSMQFGVKLEVSFMTKGAVNKDK